MTDLEKFVALYKGFGIECKVMEKYGNKYILLGGESEDSTKSELFEGYYGTHSEVLFDKNGNFTGQIFNSGR
jgi:hypothetical protein